MKVGRFLRLLAVFVFLVTAAWARPPLQEVLKGSAREDYVAGKRLFENSDFAGAFTKFKASYETSKNPLLLWNMAASQKSQRHWTQTRSLLQKFVDDRSGSITSDERREATDLLEKLRPLVGSLSINVNEAGAEIFVDDASVGMTPLPSPMELDVGPHKVRVTKDGFAESVQSVEVPGGEKKIDVALSPAEGRLLVVAGEKDTIAVDGKIVGTGRWEKSMTAGGHLVRVSASGYKTYEATVDVASGGLKSLEVTLDKEKASLLPWIIGGSVAVVALGVGAYFLFKPKDPEPVCGTMGCWNL